MGYKFFIRQLDLHFSHWNWVFLQLQVESHHENPVCSCSNYSIFNPVSKLKLNKPSEHFMSWPFCNLILSWLVAHNKATGKKVCHFPVIKIIIIKNIIIIKLQTLNATSFDTCTHKWTVEGNYPTTTAHQTFSTLIHQLQAR